MAVYSYNNILVKIKGKKKYILLSLLLVFALWYWFVLPNPIFTDPCSTVLLDKEKQLTGAKIAADGQWRFPAATQVPAKFEQLIVTFEDKHFYQHPGINPVATFKALVNNIKAQKIKTGGSTISMQVIRIARKGQNRTIAEKLLEMMLATRLELSYSKKEILAMYVSNAPFGGNVVGLEAAAWRYFGRKPEHLSWAESATLAVLPNAPSLIYPGKNQQKLLKKRNRLLAQLKERGILNEEAYSLAITEPLPGKPYPLPNEAAHLLERCIKEGKNGQVVHSTIDSDLQKKTAGIVAHHAHVLEANEIYNVSVIVAEVSTGNILAYIGNTAPNAHSNDVDIAMANRSTGSILKPFLYANMLESGDILPDMLVPDVPTQIGSYFPKNFFLTYDGAIPARRALARSLNVPIVRMLQNYGIEKFNYDLKKMGITTLYKPASHYGLSVILGGAEASLYEVTGVYTSMARILGYYASNGGYYKNNFRPLNYLSGETAKQKLVPDKNSYLKAASLWSTMEAMLEAERPDDESNWEMYTSGQKIAWKTGTSFGFRDGWCVGVTPQYVVGVWVGNADGEGRPGLTGIATAAPIMFDVFDKLNTNGWFVQPYKEMVQTQVCKQSGYKASSVCTEPELRWIPKSGNRTVICPHHKLVHLDSEEKYRVHSDCEQVHIMVHRAWFVLPPAQEYYYKTKNPTYKTLPPYRADCAVNASGAMELIYPRQYSQLYIPVEIDGVKGKTIFEVAHRKAGAIIYWHIDNKYIGYTKGTHQMAVSPLPGKHTLYLIDEEGETLSQSFEVIK